jgi:hypothetical protein
LEPTTNCELYQLAKVKASIVTSPVPSVLPPPQQHYLPPRQGIETASPRSFLQEILNNMLGVIREYSGAGGEHLGGFGMVARGFVSLCLSSFVVAKRAMACR